MSLPKTERVWVTECPRDAMQGIHDFIPTQTKADYLNQLLKAGFDVLDFGSFVSPKAIPQMQDTAQVLGKLNLDHTATKLLAIIANERGATDAASFEEITYLGFPFSISETFQRRNTNSGIGDSFETVLKIRDICSESEKEPLVYISMAFGNPYGDPWNHDIALGWVDELAKAGIRRMALADTVGVATPEDVYGLTHALVKEFPSIQTGVHLHCRPDSWRAKVEAAYNAGCRRFDAAIKGFGGCPMAKDELVGNLATENLIQFLNENNVEHGVHSEAFGKSLQHASEVFMAYS